MNNLSHYHIGTTILICPKDKTYPIVEATIVQKAQGRGANPSSVKVSSSVALYAFSEAGFQTELYAYVKPRKEGWLSGEWRVIGKMNKPKEAKG